MNHVAPKTRLLQTYQHNMYSYPTYSMVLRPNKNKKCSRPSFEGKLRERSFLFLILKIWLPIKISSDNCLLCLCYQRHINMTYIGEQLTYLFLWKPSPNDMPDTKYCGWKCVVRSWWPTKSKLLFLTLKHFTFDGLVFFILLKLNFPVEKILNKNPGSLQKRSGQGCEAGFLTRFTNFWGTVVW